MVKFIYADVGGHNNGVLGPKTKYGAELRLIARQESRREGEKKKPTIYIFHHIGTRNIYYHDGSNQGNLFMPIAPNDALMLRYYNIFVQPPLKPHERAWLDRNDYVLEAAV